LWVSNKRCKVAQAESNWVCRVDRADRTPSTQSSPSFRQRCPSHVCIHLQGLVGGNGLKLGNLAAELCVRVVSAIDEPAAEGIAHALPLGGRVPILGIYPPHEASAQVLQADIAEVQERGEGVGFAGTGVPKRLGGAFDERAALEVGDPPRRRYWLADV